MSACYFHIYKGPGLIVLEVVLLMLKLELLEMVVQKTPTCFPGKQTDTFQTGPEFFFFGGSNPERLGRQEKG